MLAVVPVAAFAAVRRDFFLAVTFSQTNFLKTFTGTQPADVRCYVCSQIYDISSSEKGGMA